MECQRVVICRDGSVVVLYGRMCSRENTGAVYLAYLQFVCTVGPAMLCIYACRVVTSSKLPTLIANLCDTEGEEAHLCGMILYLYS